MICAYTRKYRVTQWTRAVVTVYHEGDSDSEMDLTGL